MTATTNHSKQHREPLVRISKRGDLIWWKAWLIRLAAIVLAMLVCAGLIVLITGYNPIEVYVSMFKGSFGSTRKVWITMQKTALLLCISLAVTPAFKMKFWNLGAEGQVLMGACATAGCMLAWGNKRPIGLLIPVMLIAAVAAGTIWALIPAVCRAKWGTNESLFTLMMNYVAMQIVSYCITFWENPIGSNTVGIINSATSGGWLPSLFGQKYLLNILVVALITSSTASMVTKLPLWARARTLRAISVSTSKRSSSAQWRSPVRSAGWRGCCWWPAPTTPSPPTPSVGRGLLRSWCRGSPSLTPW